MANVFSFSQVGSIIGMSSILICELVSNHVGIDYIYSYEIYHLLLIIIMKLFTIFHVHAS